jgi:PAS domain S-box-containing protein
MKPTAISKDGVASPPADGHGITQKAGEALARLYRLSFPAQWTDVDRTIIWLVLGLAIYVPYLGRINYLLGHPDIEPYFDRTALSIFAICLTGVVAFSLLLILYLVFSGSPVVGRRWTMRVANQLHFVWLAVSAYAIGPFTTPILGLLLAAAIISALLFTPGVTGLGLLSAGSILVLTTAAERWGFVQYSPLFSASPLAGGRPSDAFVFGTGAVSLLAVASTSIMVLYLVGLIRRREEELMIASGGQIEASAELQRALASLRESEERFRQLAENAREVFWLMDVDAGKILYLSPTFESLWGLPVTALYERAESFLDLVHPEDRVMVRRRFGELAGIGRSGELERQLQYRIIRPTDGEQLWMQVRAFPIRDADGRAYRIGGLIEDITMRKVAEAALYQSRQALERRVAERTAELSRSNESLRQEALERERAENALRRSEEELRRQFSELELIYNTAPIGLAVLDPSLHFVRINQRLAATNGVSVEGHIGRHIREVIPTISPLVEPHLRKVLESGEHIPDFELRGPMPSQPGRVAHWISSYYPLKSLEGAVIGIGAIVQDISERVWAEEKARRSLEDLAHVARLSTMGEMTTGLAHELNQPLAAMANFSFIGLHMLEESSSTEMKEVRELFREISDQALHAGEIVQHLRDFARKEPGQRVEIALNDLVHDVLTLVDAELRVSMVELHLALLDSLPAVHADPIQIQQVILNLLRNAVEAMAETPPETRRLTITTSVPEKGAVEVAVSDSGPGLREEDATRLFDAFFTTKANGMGMGLAISRSIVEDHGGRLWGESVPRGGATFRFTLPTAEDRDFPP